VLAVVARVATTSDERGERTLSSLTACVAEIAQKNRKKERY
jgi:hypothetical protein